MKMEQPNLKSGNYFELVISESDDSNKTEQNNYNFNQNVDVNNYIVQLMLFLTMTIIVLIKITSQNALFLKYNQYLAEISTV